MINLLRGRLCLYVNERIKTLRKFEIVIAEEGVQDVLVGRFASLIIGKELHAVLKKFFVEPVEIEDDDARTKIIFLAHDARLEQKLIGNHVPVRRDGFGDCRQREAFQILTPQFDDVKVDDDVRVKVNGFATAEDLPKQQAVERADTESRLDFIGKAFAQEIDFVRAKLFDVVEQGKQTCRGSRASTWRREGGGSSQERMSFQKWTP